MKELVPSFTPTPSQYPVLENPAAPQLFPQPSLRADSYLSFSLQSDASLTLFPPLSLLSVRFLQNINWLYITKKHSMAPHCFWSNFYPPAFCDVASAYLSVFIFFCSLQATLSISHLERPVIPSMYHGVSSLCS